MLPWFVIYMYNQTNYARWGPLYLSDMKRLSQDTLEVYSQFITGNVGVKECSGTFHVISTDQALEHFNKQGKVAGGLIGITQTDSALNRWCLSYNDRSCLANQTYKLLGVDTEDRIEKHKETGRSRLQRDEDDVVNILQHLRQREFFKSKRTELVSLSTNDVAPKDVEDHLLGAFGRGCQFLSNFTDQRLSPSPTLRCLVKLKKIQKKTLEENILIHVGLYRYIIIGYADNIVHPKVKILD